MSKSTSNNATTSKKNSRRKTGRDSAKSPRRQEPPEKSSLIRKSLRFFIKLGSVSLVALIAWCVYLDATVKSKFAGHLWQLPAQVYARPLELYPTARISSTTLLRELKLLDYQQVSGVLEQPGSYQHGKPDSRRPWLAFYTRGFRFEDGMQHGNFYKVTFSNDRIDRITDRNGQTLSWARLEPAQIGGIYPTISEDRLLINLQQAPKALLDGLLTIEDKNFYQHSGISLRGIARAMVANIHAGRFVQGGSTLTQQLVKNFFLDHRQTLWRKINEALMAILLELRFEKAEILEAYLNEIFLGQDGNRAIHGFGLASQFYFATPVENLATEQAALLVALVKGASFYNPRRHPQRALQRRNLVLAEMVRAGQLTATEFATLKQRPLGVVANPVNSAGRYPAFLDLVKSQLGRDYRQEDLQTRGLKIFTTLDPAIQSQAELALTSTLQAKAKQPANEGLQGALISTSVGSGEVLAVVGDREPRYAGFNRALFADRPIGSLIKPFVFLAALANPQQFTLATIIPDEPFRIRFENGQSWAPSNFDGETHGKVIMHTALAQSLNLATARLGLMIKVESVLDLLRKLGADIDVPAYPSVLLGALNLTPLEVTGLYQNLISTGFKMPLRAIRAVTRPDGELLSRYSFETEQVLEPAVAYIGQFALYDVMRTGTGKRAYQTFPEDYFIGGKTGTTDNYRDSWFVGFNGDMLTTVWMGKDGNQPTSLTGATGAMDAWTKLYEALPKTSFSPVMPANISWAWVHEKTGELAAEHCEGAIALPFVEDSMPTTKGVCIERENMLQRWLRNWWG